MLSKRALLDEVVSDITPEEWPELERATHTLPISEFNRVTLLRLREFDPPSGEVDENRVELLRTRLASYLDEHLPKKPDAHRCIISSCIGLAFILGEPMHPLESTGIRFQVRDGAATYYCPFREDGEGSLCELCVCRSIDEWGERVEIAVASCTGDHGDVAGRITRAAFEAGMLETGVVPVTELTFHESVRRICEGNSCGGYNKTWACPPAAGDLSSCRNRCLGFERMQVVSCAYLLESEFDFESIPRLMADFDRKTDAFAESIRDIVPDALVLSNEGCTRCAKCTWPDAPCRFPEKMHPAIEGFGFVVSELAQKAKIRYNNGPRTVTFFGGVLYC